MYMKTSQQPSASSARSKSLSFWPLLIAGAAILWSIDAYLRTTLYALPPVLVSFWEHLLGLTLITPFFWRRRAELWSLRRREWRALLFIGLLAGPIGLILYMTALNLSNFANFSIVILLQQTQPIWAILLAGFVLKEPITRRFAGLAALAICGAYLIVFPSLTPNLNTGDQTALAGLLALLAAACWGGGTAMGKLVLHRVSFGTVAFARFALAAIFSLILFSVFAFIQQSTGLEAVLGTSYQLGDLGSLTSEQWRSLIIIVLTTGATAILIYYYGLKHVPARVATILEMTWPISSLVIGTLVFKNEFTLTQVVGTILLLGSMIAISRTQKEQAIVPSGELG